MGQIKLKKERYKYKPGINKYTLRLVHAELMLSMEQGKKTWRIMTAEKVLKELKEEVELGGLSDEEYKLFIMCYLLDYTAKETKKIILEAAPQKYKI